MRVLLSAYACCPGRGSEPDVGWQWARSLSSRHDVHVLTAAWAKPQLEQACRTRPLPGAHFHYIPDLLERTAAWPLGLGWLHYGWWQRRAYRIAERLHAEKPFDIAHHVTYVTWRAPSHLWRLGVPFVWGPIGGGESVPHPLRAFMGWRGRLREIVRDTAQSLGRWMPSVRATMRHAARILTANSDTKRLLAHSLQEKAQHMFAIGLAAGPTDPLPTHGQAPSPCRLLWVGRLEARKALPILLHALSQIREREDLLLTVLGDGPERSRWESLSRRLNLQNRVMFAGQVDYADVQRRYAEADIFVFTSLRDSSGGVLLEAMRSGLPVVCINCGGPGEITTDDCAIRIAPQSPEQVVRDMGEAILRLASDAPLRARLGRAGRDRVALTFAWDAKISEAERLYERLLRRGDRNELDR